MIVSFASDDDAFEELPSKGNPLARAAFPLLSDAAVPTNAHAATAAPEIRRNKTFDNNDDEIVDFLSATSSPVTAQRISGTRSARVEYPIRGACLSKRARPQPTNQKVSRSKNDTKTSGGSFVRERKSTLFFTRVTLLLFRRGGFSTNYLCRPRTRDEFY